jgi:hypothetical protein
MAEALYTNILFQKYYTFCHGISSYPYNSTSAIIIQQYTIPTIVPIIVTSHEMERTLAIYTILVIVLYPIIIPSGYLT